MASDPLLFGAVSTENAVTAVVRRLRAAIALGFLADGDRLPREADLARQLGVTAFAMREALGVLRDEGLITTRPGNKGGSFVRRGTDRALLMSGELRRMSATELRDLGDWRQMLASVSASLAAQRASDSSVKRLREYAAALGSAETELQARRAHGRFHIELAAAAQSIRMTHAELAMYEEFDWLLGAALADPQRRQESALELAAIAEAVANRLPDAARSAAQEHSASTVAALSDLRLASIASEGGERASARSVSGTVADAVDGLLAGVAQSLERLASRAGQIVSDESDERALQTGLSRVAMSGLVGSEVDLDGIGFIAEPSIVPGFEYWIAWWHLTPEGVVADHSHVMDPTRDDFYDYISQDFFMVPRGGGGGLYAQGPYVDYGGTNDYIITFSVPVLCDDRFVGVAAADLQVAAIERRLAPWLTNSEPCVVINAERRVIVSNMVHHTAGDVLPLLAEAQSAIPRVGWSVVHTPPA
jgi:DNA-binding FadR family transcriptional regulator